MVALWHPGSKLPVITVGTEPVCPSGIQVPAVRGQGTEVRVGRTFTMLAICSQNEASSTGAAVGARCVLAGVLAQAARGEPAFVHICRGDKEQQAEWAAGREVVQK